MSDPSPVTLVMLGGGLLADEPVIDARHLAIVSRLAKEIAAAVGDQARDGTEEAERASTLHLKVAAALTAAGLRPPFSIGASTLVETGGGRPGRTVVKSLRMAFKRRLLPVIHGEVIIDREHGGAGCSAERLVQLLTRELSAHGVRVRRVLWLVETDGVYDAGGRLLARLEGGSPAWLAELRGTVRAAAGSDATGDMLRRVEVALALAARGIPSLIANGTTPGLLAAALRGEQVPGTEVVAGAPS